MKWTSEEIIRFDDLIDAVGSQNQMVRITGRFDMQEFVKDHGKPKCDAMFTHLESGADKTDFDDEVAV